MNSTHVPQIEELGGLSPEHNREQLGRIVHSNAFRQATALQRLLQYLGSRAIEDPLAEIKEYTIGVDVFERGADYDPKIDTIVRVQIHRLRMKLKEYYESEGADDPILVEVPKGHYLPSFDPRTSTRINSDPVAEIPAGRELVELPLAVAGSAEAAQLPQSEVPNQLAERARRVAWSPSGAAIVLISAVIFLSGLLAGTRLERIGIFAGSAGGSSIGTPAGPKGRDPVRDFWGNFLGNDKSTIVGYADAVFLVDNTNDLLRFRRGASDDRGTAVDPHLARKFASNPDLVERAGPLYYEDGYTGTGDVESIFALTRLFTRMGVELTVKRCRLVTVDDLKEHNVILLGSPDQNDAVAQLPQIADFVFNRPNIPGPWRGEYDNHHPQPGENASYKTERDPNTEEVKANYGLITIQPGIVPGRYIAILGGLDTSGVAGAAQFVTSDSQMSELMERIAALSQNAKAKDGQPPTFQALLRVDVEKGNDVAGVRLITVHMIHPAGESPATPGSPESMQSVH